VIGQEQKRRQSKRGENDGSFSFWLRKRSEGEGEGERRGVKRENTGYNLSIEVCRY